MKYSPSSRSGKRIATETHVTTTQKVLVGVALMASVGAFAAGFAAIPRGEKGKCDGKGCQYATGQYMTQPRKTAPKTSQAKTNQPVKTTQAYQRIALQVGTAYQVSGTTTVYYYAINKKFYYFPDQATYSSWKGQFKMSNQLLPKQQLLDYGNVTGAIRIRPGTSPIGFENGSGLGKELFTLTVGGVLHKIPSAELAVSYYGREWDKKIITVPTAFVPHYIMGEPVSATTKQFSPATARDGAKTIDQDLGL